MYTNWKVADRIMDANSVIDKAYDMPEFQPFFESVTHCDHGESANCPHCAAIDQRNLNELVNLIIGE